MKKVLLGLSAALALTLGLGALAIGDIKADAATWSDVTLSSDYSYGAELQIPARTVKVGDKTVEATSILTYPDGSATLQTDVTLDMVGTYSLAYNAIVDGQAYSETLDLSVYDSIYYIGSGSEAVYELNRYAATHEGLSVRLAQGSTLSFAPILDLSETTKDDVLVDFFITPDERGKYDFERLIFTFTDVEDPASSFRVTARASADGPAYPATYCMAAGPGQPLSGWENNGPHVLLHTNNEWGAWIPHSFAGVYHGVEPDLDERRLSIRYDVAENAVYVNSTFVIDFDSSLYFSKLWGGLTSGRVRLTISADGYNNSTANFVIDELIGVDLSDDRLLDTVDPVITVETEYEEPPLAKTGLAYPVPAAMATDDYSGECAVRTSVWYNYTSGAPVSVPLHGGAFTPQRPGTYTVVYRTQDRLGNTSKELLTVEARDEVPAISLTISDAVKEGTAGSEYPVAEANASGGCGNVSITCRAFAEGFEEQLEGTFRPRKAGTYTVEYIATDYLGQTAKASYTFTASATDLPVFDENFVLPRYFISGSHYAVPEVYAYDYSTGEEKPMRATLTVTDVAGTRAVEGADFVPTVFSSGDLVKLTFKAKDAELVREVPAIIAFEVGNGRMSLNMRNYLIDEGVSIEMGEETTTVSATEASGSWSFAKELLLEGFSAELRAISARSRFSALTLTLTDSLDPSVSASVSLLYQGGKTYAEIGKTTIELTAGFQSNAQSRIFEISYRRGAFTVCGTTVDYAADGFVGFTSRYVYLTVAFENAANGSAYLLRSICEQPITTASADRIKPKIAVEGNYGGTISVGEDVVVRRGFAGDVLDPEVTFYVSVIMPDESFATSADGILLEKVSPDREYTFPAKSYGQYRIVYTAADTFNGKEQEFVYAVTVEDREAPVIKLEGTMPETVKLGEYIVLPGFSVEDNVSETLEIHKFIVTTTGTIVELPGESNAFKPLYEGIYRIRIYVRDAAGNATLAEYAVTVTA